MHNNPHVVLTLFSIWCLLFSYGRLMIRDIYVTLHVPLHRYASGASEMRRTEP